MKINLTKRYLAYLIIIFFVFGIFIFSKLTNPHKETANLLSAVASPSPIQTATVAPSISEDEKKLNPPREVNLMGRVVTWMTYGRILVKNLSPNPSFMYFIAEPDDVIEDGALRYSPTTDPLKYEDVVKIFGKMTAECYWDEESYGGCVPWVEIEKLQQAKTDEVPPIATSNLFGSLRYQTISIKESNNHASIDIEYPQVIGGDEIENLNKYIKNRVLDKLSEDRERVKQWMSGNARDPSVCSDADDFQWECAVSLKSTYRVASIINDIVSMEIIFTDWTGGGNGNHDEPVIINYDLKNDRVLNTSDLFCNKDYVKNLSPNAYYEIYRQILMARGATKEEAVQEARDRFDYWKANEEPAEPESFLKNILLGYSGVAIVYPPYQITGGAVGIVRIPLPYYLIRGDICLP